MMASLGQVRSFLSNKMLQNLAFASPLFPVELKSKRDLDPTPRDLNERDALTLSIVSF